MQNIQIKIPRISRILGTIFFFLALIIIGYFTISEYAYCNSLHGPKEACGIVTMFVNIPVVYFSDFYSSGMPSFLSPTILVLCSSVFWAFIGVIIGLFITVAGLIIRQIRGGSHQIKFVYLVIAIIIFFMLLRFFAINFLI